MTSLRRWAWILLAVIPFLGIYATHLGCFGPSATGFLQADQPNYLANARAIFERGNGFSHPNPFDEDPSSPSIYFLWPTWVMGALMRATGADPGALFVALGVLMALAFARLTWEVAAFRVRAQSKLPFVFLCLFWGGGLFTLAALAAGIRDPGSFDPLGFDPARGMWFLNWGRNAVYPLEALYHALFLGFWIAMMRQRWVMALACFALVLAAHPYTGAELLLGAAFWLLFAFAWFRASTPPHWFLGGVVAVCGAFAWYYFAFLPSFPSHRVIQAQVELPFNQTILQNLLALLPVALAAIFSLRKRKLTAEEGLALAFFLAAFLLSNHQWFMRAREPLHFARGYPWFALAWLGIPALEAIASRARLAWLLLPLFSADNFAFLFQGKTACVEQVGLAPEVREIFRYVEGEQLTGVLFSPLPRVCLLTPTYTRLTPYCPHLFLTPHSEQRVREVLESFTTRQPGKWLARVDYLILGMGDATDWLRPEEWEPVVRKDRYLFLRRKAAKSSPTNTTAAPGSIPTE